MIWNTLFDPVVSEQVCLTLAHSVWQTALLVAVLFLIGRLSKHASAQSQYMLHFGAMLLALAALPSTYLLSLETSASTANGQISVSPTVPLDAMSIETAPAFENSTISIPASDRHQAKIAPLPNSRSTKNPTTAWNQQSLIPWIFGLYLAGVALMLTRLVRGIAFAERMRRFAIPITTGPIVELASKLASELSLRTTPAISAAGHVCVPKLVGLIRPTILLPAQAISGLSQDELRMILAHEFAHVRRFDMWVNLVQRLAESILFFNPVIWYLSRRISVLREYCCDDLACGEAISTDADSQLRYASALLKIVQLVEPSERNPDIAALAATNGSPSELRRRVARLLGERISEPLRISRSFIVVSAAMMLALFTAPMVWKSTAQEIGSVTRTLSFPQGRTVGMVFSRPTDFGGHGAKGDWYGGWEPVGPATRTVKVRLDHDARLIVSELGAKDLRCLRRLDPNSVASLSLKATHMGDDQLAHVGTLTGLQVLDLEETEITDTGFQNLRGLIKLKRLDLSAFGVDQDGFGVGDDAMLVVAEMPMLESINLRRTKVTDAGLAALAKCKSLQSIHIEGTDVTDSGLVYLLALPKLKSLSLGVYDEGASITGAGLKTVGKMTQLTSLRLSGTSIGNDDLIHLAPLQRLVSLNIDNTNVTQDGLEHLAPLKSLEKLRCIDTVTDGGAKHLSKLSNLRRISASLDVSDEGVAELSKLPHLEYMRLSDDTVTNKSIDSILRMKSMRDLTLSGAKIDDKNLSRLAKLTSLEALTIRGTKGTPACLRALKDLPNLKRLSLEFVAPDDAPMDWSPLSEFVKLEGLRLDGATFRNNDLRHIRNLRQLESLNLYRIELLTDSGIENLKNLTNLKDLEIEQSVVSDQGLKSLSGMRSLAYATIHFVGTDQGLMALKNLTSMRHLQIASPSITDEGVDELARHLPAVQRATKTSYQINGQEISASAKDSYWRVGRADDRTKLNAMEGQPPPELKYSVVHRSAPAIGPIVTASVAPRLARLRGKVVLVDIWGVSSGPDLDELSELKRIYKKYEELGLEIVGVHSDKATEKLDLLFAKYQVPWPICVDTKEQTREAWRLHSNCGYYIIDRQGTLRYAEIHRSHLEPAIAALLKEPVPESNVQLKLESRRNVVFGGTLRRDY